MCCVLRVCVGMVASIYFKRELHDSALEIRFSNKVEPVKYKGHIA